MAKQVKDKNNDGEFKDTRKSKLFIIDPDKLQKKTQLEGLRETIFRDRYSLKDENGDSVEEYPEQLWMRVAKGIAQFETTEKKRSEWESKFYNLMEDFKFVPAGRILSGAGTGYEVTFFNCYVIPSPPDSRGGIMENITQTVEIQSRAGGVGVNLSSLRPRGARVQKVNGTSSGPVNWASLYSTANHDVIQQGGSRRGALMLMLNDWHPDIEEFITVKQDLSKIPGANLSVCVSDKFMDAVKNDENWDLVFPKNVGSKEYDENWNGDLDEWIANGGEVEVYKTVEAKKIWDMIADAAWRSAEPGLHFIERSNKRSNTWYFERLIATNPCGEQPLGAWSVCNLGAMNLTQYVNENAEFDYKSLAEDSKIAMRFMDNVVDANFYFYPETWDSQSAIRRTGLGTMGLGDALIKMKIPYGSDESIEVIEKIYKTIRDNAYLASSELASEKGSFPKFEKKKYLDGWFIKRLPKNIQKSIEKNGIRNAVLLTQAPTGTTSLFAGVSSGIEPNFNFEYKRTDRTGEHIIYHPLFEEWKKANPDKEKPDYFVSAMDLTPMQHLKVQAKIQEYTDSSISKTVNAPETYSVEDVKELYTKAYDLGLKGITFFRDGSRQGVLENVKEDKPAASEASGEAKDEKPTNGVHVSSNSSGQLGLPVSPGADSTMITRPTVVHGSTYKVKTPMGSAFITINQDNAGEPIEIFINIGKAGSDITAMAAALGRTISSSLRFRSNLSPRERAKEIAAQLSGIGGRRSVGFGPNKVRSLPDAVAMALMTHFEFNVIGNGNGNGNGHSTFDFESEVGDQSGSIPTMYAQADYESASAQADICPECGEHTLVFEEGCAKCYSCGHSEC